MRLFLILLFAFILTENGWGQQVIIKEDFEFYWPLQQYNISGDWDLEYPGNSNDNEGQSRQLRFSTGSSFYFDGTNNYDSVYIELTRMSGFTAGCYDNMAIEGSTDSTNWVELISTSFYTFITNHFITISSSEYPYIRLNSPCGGAIDNLLVIGYTDNVSTNYCQFDTNGDGNIGAPDLLAFLEVYGTFLDCE